MMNSIKNNLLKKVRGVEITLCKFEKLKIQFKSGTKLIGGSVGRFAQLSTSQHRSARLGSALQYSRRI